MIPEIKQRFTILDAVNKYGNEPIQKGSKFWIQCFLHSDKTPSLMIDPSKDRFHCFSCKISGNQIDFVSKATGLSLKDTILLLGNELGISEDITPAKRKEIEQEQKRRLLAREEKEKKISLVNEQYSRLADCFRLMNLYLDTIQSEKDLDREEIILSLKHKDRVEHYLDLLMNDDLELKYKVACSVKDYEPLRRC